MTNQQLKAHCEDVIANPQDNLDWVVDMARVVLASLEAEPVYQLIDDGNWWDAPKYLFDEAKERGEQHRVVYAAPPVPVMQPIDTDFVYCCLSDYLSRRQSGQILYDADNLEYLVAQIELLKPKVKS